MKCSWCGALLEAGQATCPRCGVAIAAIGAAARSGWAKLPGRKDMAKLQFGNSACQIEGTYVPVADLKLAPEDWVTFAHHTLLWKDPSVTITAVATDGPWKMLAGPSHLLMEARGPGHIAFSQDSPGELVTLPLEPGQHVHVRQQAQSLKQERSTDPQKHLFLAATGNVTYTWFDPGVWFHSEEGALDEDHHYPVGKTMDRFGARDGPGLLLLHAAGNVFVRQLAAGQHILVKPAALVFKDATVKMDLHYEIPSGAQPRFANANHWNSGYIWLRLYGPGRVAVQSVFEGVEGEALFTLNFNKHSVMTASPIGLLPPPVAVPVTPLDKGCLLKFGIFLLVIDVALVAWLRHFVAGPEGNMNKLNDHSFALISLIITGFIGIVSLLSALAMMAQARAAKRKAKLAK